MRAVLICHNPRLGQGVIDTLNANGVSPWLICDPTTSGSLQASRLIKGTLLARPDLHQRHDEILQAILTQHAVTPFDVAVAADVEGALILDAIKDRLPIPLYPQADKATLELLNDKWQFRNLCQELRLPTPETLHFPDKTHIDPYMIAQIGYPVVLKPTSRFSSIGVRVVASSDELRRIIDDPIYRSGSIIVQQYIDGQDIGLSVFCRDGKIIAATTFFCGDNDATMFLPITALRAMGERICAATNYNGVANFDARIEQQTGNIMLFECNPRFFMRLSACRICGLDLLGLGLPGQRSLGQKTIGNYYAKTDILKPRGMMRILTGQWRASVLLRSWGEALHDPMPLIKRHLGADPLKR